MQNYQGSGPGNQLFRNEVGENNEWLQVDLVGVASTAAGIGATIRVMTAAGVQTRLAGGGGGNPLRAAFGLGSATLVDTLQVLWPSGVIQNLPDVAARQRITVVEIPTDVGTIPAGQPTLLEIYPNPAGLGASIVFTFLGRTEVRITVHDVRGRLVATLLEGVHDAGRHAMPWPGSGVSRGVYFVRMEAAGRQSAARKIVVR